MGSASDQNVLAFFPWGLTEGLEVGAGGRESSWKATFSRQCSVLEPQNDIGSPLDLSETGHCVGSCLLPREKSHLCSEGPWAVACPLSTPLDFNPPFFFLYLEVSGLFFYYCPLKKMRKKKKVAQLGEEVGCWFLFLCRAPFSPGRFTPHPHPVHPSSFPVPLEGAEEEKTRRQI